MEVATLAGSGNGAAFCFSYRPNTPVPAFSLLRFEGAVCLLFSEAPRSWPGAFGWPRADSFVEPVVDWLFATSLLSAGLLLPAVFGPDRILRLAVPSNRRLFGDRNRNVPERPSGVP